MFLSKPLRAAALAAAPLLSLAAEVVPVSYTFDQATSCGSYCYHDETRTQLTDGQYGVEGWGVDLGNGNAYEWVGWLYNPVINMDFNLGSAQSIDSIKVGSTQDALWDVTLPSLSVSYWNGSTWVLAQSLVVPPGSANDRGYLSPLPHGFLTLSGLGINAQYIRVTATANGPWTFVDEVDFFTARVPEPATYALMALGLACVAALARRRRS